MTYNKPSFEKVASFKNKTMGLWFGNFKDLFGGKIYIALSPAW
ncbi:putative RiPP precursor [Ruminococcus flavefaciens]|nr:putative RiPP precursor [Ruminococcus flavefaciens]